MSEKDINTAIAHVVLGAVAAGGLRSVSDASFVHPGMHVNCLLHGILGFLNYSGAAGDLAAAYKISHVATLYLPLPCLMADLYRGFGNHAELMRGLHILSGVVPFVLTVSGNENKELGQVCIVLNIASLAYYSYKKKVQWGWFTAGAGVLAYFVAPEQGKLLYPLCLALMEYCAYRVYGIRSLQ